MTIGIIYIAQNKAMPELIKIGKTTRTAGKRVAELYKTNVPFPFVCLWAGEMNDHERIEKLLHKAFSFVRVNPNREFFQIDPQDVIPLAEELCIKNATPTTITTQEVEKILNGTVLPSEKKAAQKYQRRPVLNFSNLGIEPGDELIYTQNHQIKALVVSEKKVKFEGKEYSLTALTRKIKNLPYSVAPCPYWSYNGKNLQIIYDEANPVTIIK